MAAVPKPFGITHAGLAYLAARGCSPEMADAAGIRFITHAEANDLLRTSADKRSHNTKHDALWIPTHHLDGTVHPYHGQAIFFNPGKKAFKVHTKKTADYPNEVNYLIAKAPVAGDTVYWCESTIKALVIHSMGLNAVGMNGVNGFSKGKNQIVDSARHFAAGVTHVLLTDSLNSKNKRSMGNVLAARRRWRLALKSGLDSPTLRYIEHPRPPLGYKDDQGNPKFDWGLDDFKVHRGADAVKNLLTTAQEFRDADLLQIWLDEFNERFVFVKSLSKVYDKEANQFLAKQAFFDNYASVNAGEGAVAPVWFRSTNRPEVQSLAFRPGEEQIVDDNLNVWQGFGLEPASTVGDAKHYWLGTIEEMFGKRDAKIFVEECAALVQMPGKRRSRFIYLGGKPGTGKNFVVEPLVRIFGEHCQSWTVKNFINNFNSSHRNCRLGILNEPGDPATLDRRTLTEVGEVLKKNADQNERWLQLEQKGVDLAVVDRLQYNIVISNFGPPFVLSANDRRCVALAAGQHMAIEQPNNRGTKDLSYWNARWDWLNNQGGAAEVMAYLLDYKLDGVDLDGPAPMTAHKTALLRIDNMSVLSFMELFNNDPVSLFKRVLGDEWQAPETIIFDANVISMLYGHLNHSVEREAGFETAVGKYALQAWECQSTQVSWRLGKSIKGARVYAVRDNRIIEKPGSISGTECGDALAELKTQIVLLLEGGR